MPKNLKKQVGEDLERITGVKIGSGGGIGLKDKHPEFYAGTEGGADKPLFGEDDEIINALEMETREVKDDLDRCDKNLVRLQAGMGILGDRLALLKKATDTMRKRHAKPKPKGAGSGA